MSAALNDYQLPDVEQALSLSEDVDTAALMARAARLRDGHFRNLVTYSRKVFIPLTQLCRDVCHYCTFAQTPNKIAQPYLMPEEVIETVRNAASLGCKEALFTLGERPEDRYSVARKALEEMGFPSTLAYVAHVAKKVLEETGVLPHINAGCMSREEIEMLRPVSASMGLMLESLSTRLCAPGKPHYGSPDKHPERRLETLRLAGEARVPFTTGILIGIGETRRERIESLLAIRELHIRYGHIQEVIVQNFRAKPGTRMAQSPEPDLEELLWTIAVARLIFGPTMNIQAPPNLSPGVLPKLLQAGINDWGGVSPVTPDFVNPEAPWPHVENLARESALAGKYLQQRLTIYPEFAVAAQHWLDSNLRSSVLKIQDAEGYARTDDWVSGQSTEIPQSFVAEWGAAVKEKNLSRDLLDIVARAVAGEALAEKDILRLFRARGPEFTYVCQQADQLRKRVNGDKVRYVVNRNINYTNVCYFKCQFCAFSKGKLSENLRGRPYNLDQAEIYRRTCEAWSRGATEVCMQGGIHPDYTGQTYLDILATIKSAAPKMHVHAFSPLEVWQGAKTLGMSVRDFLKSLKHAGLGSLPGTAAEVLDDEVRRVLCPDKINTREWLEVIQCAHEAGLPTTSTIMFGHVDRPVHWARHLMRLRALQSRTGGITEFVPLPFVASESPIFLKGHARKGPTLRETVLMHAVARLALHGSIDHIQTSWVKMGESGTGLCLNSGADDLGGTLMNETITRSAGARHGQEMAPPLMENLIRKLDRVPGQRTTLYAEVPEERIECSLGAAPLEPVINTPLGSRQREEGRGKSLVRSAPECPANDLELEKAAMGQSLAPELIASG
ncbi:5-amino-6-(D-ribitylamino)uracil--L-tyrosine 4-hydroxyphenyl transferase CofH [Microbulbifer elongatus]|uniref:5-amino-6-(D-ribitylamino)uracil--L-tyrosine 4-hydroxyphenyl transferase CofH n=1 Tax=Microbulbifer elongatus TaxID=86173 RepID=UPI001CFD6E4D|nr:5-amino-6-(D-ribitylamino)uracil--L-tyrosine 4-hydroxyphenyl transferase CofH [Microbulbifer elongatus]